MEDVRITGSCNGLVCLSHGVVWNPTTNEYKVIPRSTTLPTQPDESIWGTYGFGYDASSQDYKFVRIVGSSTGKKSEVDVYSLGSNSWKRFQCIPYLISRGSGVFCNGALHWIAFSYSGNNGRYIGQVLIALDVGNESVQEIPQPENLDAGKFGAYRYASVLDRCLCMLCSSLMDGYAVWMMKDYGMRESWTKLYRIRALINTSASSGIEYLKKVVYLKNGEILLQIKQNFDGDEEALILYNPKDEGATKILKHYKRSYSGVFQVENYVKNLVSLNSGTYVGDKEQERKDRSIAFKSKQHFERRSFSTC